MNNVRISNHIEITYYSGTGCTEKVANCFLEAFSEKNYDTNMQKITYKLEQTSQNHDFLMLLFPVHAMNAPDIVCQWIKNLKKVSGTEAAVISVSAGGEVTPNTACRSKCIRLLEEKGYRVCYEKMIVMPSNFFVSTPERVAAYLIKILPEKVFHIVNDILNGEVNRTTPYSRDYIFTVLGKMETMGAKWIGRSIRVSDTCNGCGWCIDHCPAGNITMKNKKPHFAWKCHLCMKCIYGCPNNALSPKIGRSIVFKQGFNIKKIDTTSDDNETDLMKLCEGNWKGVKEYISEHLSYK